MIQLRDYQTDAIKLTLQKYASGERKQVLVLATGLGKTVIFAHIIKELLAKNPTKKALVVAHREELLTQARNKILQVEPTLTVEIEMAEQKASPSANVIVASVATIGRSDLGRIEKFDPNEFCCIVIDEAHHASAQSYQNILQYFGVLKNAPEKMLLDDDLGGEKDTDWNTECLLLGVTATPSRMDNQGIDQIFDTISYEYNIIDGIKNNWLSHIHAYRVDTTTSLDTVHTLGGDFKSNELSQAINTEERNKLVVKTYIDRFKMKQALVFAIDTLHATELTEEFQKNKIATALITGKTEKDIRKMELEAFHKKDIQVIVNCMVLTEGYDNDTIDIIMMARPTKSGILYSQMLGRGTRIHHEKPFLTVVDFVDNTYKHSIKTAATLLGVEGKIDFQGQDILDALEVIEEIQEKDPNFNFDKLDMNRIEYVMEEVDLIGGLGIPAPLREITPHSWLRYGEDAYRINLGNNGYIIVEQQITGQWKASVETWNSTTRQMSKEALGEEQALITIIKRADQYIINNHPDALKLINMQARWRMDEVSVAQRTALLRLGVASSIIDQLDKGKASQLQTKLYTSLARQKAMKQTRRSSYR